ncbi:MAG TPA: glycosyltransferase, partial [Flavobacteriales bacterium]|nr:glycosyltransferase [Flavobacteriales bacterium]
RQVKDVFTHLEKYNYEHIFIDNSSTDSTEGILRKLASNDENVKVILNTRNFGHIRSPYYAMLQARGDAVISVVSDLQDPPHLIKDFLRKWEDGYKVVVGLKKKSREFFIKFRLRQLYYKILDRLSETKMINDFTGFGLYDRKVIDALQELNDPYPFFRGLVAELGFEYAQIEYDQPIREKGSSKNNLYTLYDMAILGIVNHSKVPLRMATMLGFFLSALSFLVSVFYFTYKIYYWESFEVGIAPVVIGLFFFASVQLLFIGVLGEYVGLIYTQVLQRPLVIEKERINF